MSNEIKWHSRWVELAKHVSSWSKDPSTQVGAVLAKGKEFYSFGYNGFPPNIKDDDRYNDRSVKYDLIIHAEINAVLNAHKDVRSTWLYLYPMPPCIRCCVQLITAGISGIVVHQDFIVMNKRFSRWNESLQKTYKICKEADIPIYILLKDKLIQ